MKKLIYQKFLKDVTIFFCLSLLSLGLIMWVIQAVNFLDFVSEDGHGFKVYFLYTLLTLPKILGKILPFIFFISLFYSLSNIEENNELLIFWTNGITKKEFLNTILIYSLLYFFIQLSLNIYITPFSQDKARSYIRSSNIDFFPSLIKEKKFIDTVENLTIFIESKENNQLFNIFLRDQFNINQSQTIFAKRGLLKSNESKNYLLLYDGEFINNNNGKINNFSFEKTEFDLSKYGTKTTKQRKIQETDTFLLIKCIRYIYDKKIFYDPLLDCLASKTSIIEEIFKRVYLPIYIPLLALIASLLIIKSKDSFNYTRYKVGLFIIGTLTIVISEVSIRYSAKNELNSLIFLLVPLALFLFTYLYLINKSKKLI